MAASQALIQKYKDLIINLLPPGKVWRPSDQPVLDALIESLALELCRADDKFNDMLRDIDPSTTVDLLDDWERILGLPDECTPDGLTDDQRRIQVVQKLTNVGGISKTFYEFLMTQLGFPTATVNDYLDFQVGRGKAGDPLSNYFLETLEVGETIGVQLRVEGWRYYFNAHLPATAAEVFEVGDTVGNPLRDFSNELIECTLKKLKPAHTAVFFTFFE